jgi:hypothetical protein
MPKYLGSTGGFAGVFFGAVQSANRSVSRFPRIEALYRKTRRRLNIDSAGSARLYRILCIFGNNQLNLGVLRQQKKSINYEESICLSDYYCLYIL